MSILGFGYTKGGINEAYRQGEKGSAGHFARVGKIAEGWGLSEALGETILLL